MKKQTVYIKVTIDYEIECELPDFDETDETNKNHPLNPESGLISGNGFNFDLSELEDIAESQYLVNAEINAIYPSRKQK